MNFKNKIVAITILVGMLLEFPDGRELFRVADKDEFVNVRIEADSKAKVSNRILNGQCVVAGSVYKGWRQIIYASVNIRYGGYIHHSRLVADSTCQNEIDLKQIGECDYVELGFHFSGSFKDLFAWYKSDYIDKCDDGCWAESLSEFVVSNLSSNWSESLSQIYEYKNEANFIALIMKHIDTTSNGNDLKNIMSMSDSCRETNPICKELHIASKNALKDLNEYLEKSNQIDLIVR